METIDRLQELFVGKSRSWVEDVVLGAYTIDDDSATCLPGEYEMGVCTHCARRVIHVVGCGKIVGYYESKNPGTLAANGCGGHDFALIDHRYIVDVWWTYFVSEDNDGPIFDLADSSQSARIRELYGLVSKWEEAPLWATDFGFAELVRHTKHNVEEFSGGHGQCPSCGAIAPDADGVGIVKCHCGWCSHISATGGTCDLCGKDMEKSNAQNGATTGVC